MDNSSENFKTGKSNKEIVKHRGPYKIDEASLNRAYQHVVEKKVPSWGMLTAYRYANSKKQNIEANKKLEADLRTKGYGYFKVEGHWQECQDKRVNYFDCPKDKLVDSTEISLFVPNIGIKQIHKLGKQFEQDSVLYGGEDTKGKGVLVYKNGRVENVGDMHPDNMQQAYSKMRNTGKVFAFQRKKFSLAIPTLGVGGHAHLQLATSLFGAGH